MTEPVQWLAIAASLALFLLTIELVRRRILVEEYSFIWILVSAGLLALSIRRQLLHTLADWLGVHYPPAVLLLVLMLLGFVGAMFFSVVVSRQRKQIERLVEDTAILSAQMRDLVREKKSAQSSGPAP